jgi:hypothetical protein
MAEPADQPHAVELAGLFLEAPDEKHLSIGVEFILLAEPSEVRSLRLSAGADPFRAHLSVVAPLAGGGLGLRHRLLRTLLVLGDI